MNHPDDGKTRPVIIYRQGHPPQAALMNDKAYSKSREQGELWTLHPETGRLIPFEGGGRLLELVEETAWFTAKLEGRTEASGEKYNLPNREAGAAAEAGVGDEGSPPSSSPEGEKGGNKGDLTGALLKQLQALIDDRRQTLPEGSYTTHLFNKGSEKIRKKTGEEAVELILAQSKEDIIYESADLIYHLMVLLSAEGLSIEEVLAELARRHG